MAIPFVAGLPLSTAAETPPSKPPVASVDGKAPEGATTCIDPAGGIRIIIGQADCPDQDSGGDFNAVGAAGWCPDGARCIGTVWEDSQLVYPSSCRQYDFEVVNTLGYTVPYMDVSLARTNGEILVEVYGLNIPNDYYDIWEMTICPSDLVDGAGPYEIQFWYVLSDSFFYEPATVVFRAGEVFLDIPAGRAFAQEIQWLASSGVTRGFSDGTFRPLGTVNRDAMAAFLYRFAGQPAFTPPRVSPFTDITPSTPFYKEITWLSTTGITGGFSDRTFRPSQPVNRDAMAAFLYRFAGEPAFTPPRVSPFSDATQSRPFYKEITWLASTEVTGGFNDGTYRPAQPVNRDAMAAFLFRFDQKGLAGT
jgi:hypothetical protein